MAPQRPVRHAVRRFTPPPVSPPGQLKTDPTTKITTQSILPFTGLNNPTGVTLDSQGNL
jgi:hypothetical protein